MTFEILNESTETYVDITPYITINGLEYQLSDIDSPDAGRTLDGIMHRGKIGDKEKWGLKFRTLTTAEMQTVISLVSNEVISVKFLSPKTNSVVVKSMYVGDRKASHCRTSFQSNTVRWSGLAFSLIEI